MGSPIDRSERERWQAALKAKNCGGRPQGQAAMAKQCGKGIGPNKACGHKGGICRHGPSAGRGEGRAGTPATSLIGRSSG